MQTDVQSAHSRARCCRRCWRCPPARPGRPAGTVSGAAAGLGRQHGGGRAAAADLQRLDAAVLRAWCCSRPASAVNDGGPIAGVRRLRAVPGRRALVRRRLHRAIAARRLPTPSANWPHASAPIPPHGAGATAHPAVFAHPVLRDHPGARPARPRQHRKPRRRHHGRSRRAGATINFNPMHGPEYRGVYDLADLDRSLFMMAPGQSGNLLSRHARDFLRAGATARPSRSARNPTQPRQPSD